MTTMTKVVLFIVAAVLVLIASVIRLRSRHDKPKHDGGANGYFVGVFMIVAGVL